MMDLLKDMHERQAQHLEMTKEIKTALFGMPGQEYLGHVPRTEVRLASIESRAWKAIVGSLIALIGVVWQWLVHKG